MTRTTFKRVPFNLELAKKITNVEVKGHIVTRDGRQARIICFDRKENEDIFDPPKNIVALVENKDGSEGVLAFRNDGMILLNEETDYDLQIEVPTYYRDYSNFKPCKWQPVLVRNLITDMWLARVATGERTEKGFGINSVAGEYKFFTECLPISKLTINLLGTSMSYDELLEKTW